MEEELLCCLVGIHGALLEGCVDLLVAVVSGDLLDVLDSPPDPSGDRNPSASATHLAIQGGRVS